MRRMVFESKAALQFETAYVGDQRLDLVIAAFVTEGLHLELAILVDSFLDDLDGLVVGEGSLDFGVGEVLDLQLAANRGLSLAVLAMAHGAIFVPGLLYVPRSRGPAGHTH